MDEEASPLLLTIMPEISRAYSNLTEQWNLDSADLGTFLAKEIHLGQAHLNVSTALVRQFQESFTVYSLCNSSLMLLVGWRRESDSVVGNSDHLKSYRCSAEGGRYNNRISHGGGKLPITSYEAFYSNAFNTAKAHSEKCRRTGIGENTSGAAF